MNSILCLILTAFVSLAAVYWIFPSILKLARAKNIVDNPDARKLQKMPVPVLGGLAVFFGLAVGVGFAYCVRDVTMDLVPLFMAAVIMLYMGLMDDCLGLSAAERFFFETIAILILIFGGGECVDSFHGMWGVGTFSWYWAVPLTVFAGVGIINAFNMIDGVNGLSSGLCILCSVLMCTIFFKRSDMTNAVLAVSFAGALVPFFLHNVFGKVSKMFIGDSGTMVMGMLVSWYMIQVMSSTSPYENANLNPAAMILAVASVPVADTLRVMGMRILKGRSPFSPDKTHLHHMFISLGVSHSITTFTEIFIDGLVVAAWYLSYKMGASLNAQMWVTIGVAAFFVWGLFFFIRYHFKHKTRFLERMVNFNSHTHFGQKKWWLALQHWQDRDCYEDTPEE